MQYTIVDDDVEAAPIYRCDGKASQPVRPHENHGLCMEHMPTQMLNHTYLCVINLQKHFHDFL